MGMIPIELMVSGWHLQMKRQTGGPFWGIVGGCLKLSRGIGPNSVMKAIESHSIFWGRPEYFSMRWVPILTQKVREPDADVVFFLSCDT